MSFSTEQFPSVAKIAKVILLHKEQSKVDYTNYRPISLLSNIEKIIEKIMYKRLYNFVDINNLIYLLQFDFRSKYPTTHALINLTYSIRQPLYEASFGCGRRHLILLIIKSYSTNESVMESEAYVMTGSSLTCQIVDNMSISMDIVLI